MTKDKKTPAQLLHDSGRNLKVKSGLKGGFKKAVLRY